MLACYQALRTRRPELAQAQILQNVSDELRRAKRTEDEERFYRDAVANSQQFAQVAGAFTLAARRGDVDGLCQLLDRYERLQAGRTSTYYYTGSYYFDGPGPALSEGMSVCAGRKAYDDVLKILDYELAALRRRLEHQSPGAAARANRAMYASYGAGYIAAVPDLGRQDAPSTSRVDFPLPNDYVDETAIQVLRTAFELYKRDDLVSDLVAHFRRQAEAASNPADAAYPRLCASYVLLWNGDKDEAIAEFSRVAETSRPESGLRLELAELLEQQGDRDDALAAGRRGPAARQRHHEAPRGAGAAGGRPGRQPRARPAGGRAALRPPARHRHPGPALRPDAPARPARAGRGRAGPRPPTAPATRPRPWSA